MLNSFLLYFTLLLILSFFSKQNRPLVMNEDQAEDPLAVRVGKGLANKLGNAQERKHLGLRDSSDFLENVPKLYLANHIPNFSQTILVYLFILNLRSLIQRKNGQGI